jgi:hypothetical protein
MCATVYSVTWLVPSLCSYEATIFLCSYNQKQEDGEPGVKCLNRLIPDQHLWWFFYVCIDGVELLHSTVNLVQLLGRV